MFFDNYKRARKGIPQRSELKQLARVDVPYEVMSDAELLTIPAGAKWVFDIESYPNYFCASFAHVDSGKVVYFEDSPVARIDVAKLRYMLWNFCTIGFYSRKYDLPVTAVALEGLPASSMHEASLRLIRDNVQPGDMLREINCSMPDKINHIDLFDVAPLEGSLKLYAARLHSKRLQELPYNPETELTQAQAADVLAYNITGDLPATIDLYKELCPQIDLRETLGAQYGQDLRSLSDAQIAEAVICSELEKLNGRKPRKPKPLTGLQFFYEVPHFVRFQTPAMQAALDAVRASPFTVDEFGVPRPGGPLGGDHGVSRQRGGLSVAMGGCLYQLGTGGLHSTEECAAHFADEDTLLIDRDVASYYPRIILNQGLYPRHLGPAFLEVYNALVERRLAAKKAGAKVMADSLKITINGSFGKLGDPYSTIYSPQLMVQVTLSGQLCLLMLIEMAELAGIPVISANTDGVVFKCPKSKYEDLLSVVAEWERVTSFETEETQYSMLLSRDVNNYYAVKTDGKIKTKGVYSEVGSALNSVLSKNPEALIVSDAVQAFVLHRTPIEQTIQSCKDVRRFVAVKRCKGGAEKDGVYLGKVVRWYYAKGCPGPIRSVISGNAVGKTEGARPAMDLPATLPPDIDYDWYVNAANQTLYDVGFFAKPQARLF